ncbi:hypothetical protein AAEO56_18745 [Flavobacterium sp. DGU11]|uniref:Trypsin-like peptidase domain-containing protein n=1 Tax=Flavobacterium arundinis TaxID=3139143 RepID=A0ABU9I1L1_9FLAO
MSDEILQLAIILFLLSMICERIADFLKHYLCGNKFLGINDTLTRNPGNDIEEKAREYRIMKINVWSGILVAAIIKADMIMIFSKMKNPGETLGWNTFGQFYEDPLDKVLLVPGILLTGCFISFGSKFWHDLVDILYQIKNAKRVASDSETYKIDATTDLEKAAITYQSSFIQSAYIDAKIIYMAHKNVKAISLKRNENGYYLEVTVSNADAPTDPYFTYRSPEGLYHTIPVKTIFLGEGDMIMAHNIDLSSKIFDTNQSGNWGTLGIIVKPLEKNSAKRYLLTCCHNVIKPLSNLPYTDDPAKIVTAATTDNNTKIGIGKVYKAVRDREADAALIEIDPAMVNKISKYIPKIGTPLKPRIVTDDDENKVMAYMFGAKTGPQSGRTQGMVTSAHSTIKVTYNSTEEFEIINTIAISNNGKAISEPGDSGACVVDGKYNVLGIVVAGSSEVTYILPIRTLLSKFEVQLA